MRQKGQTIMMMSEFYERTGYTPSYDEYKFIEDSYYEFAGDKNEFCKWWKKANKSGEWATELKFRQRIDELTKELAKTVTESEESLDFYRPYFDRAVNAEAILKMADKKVNFSMRMKGEPQFRHHKNVTVKYVNTSIQFINVIEDSGWMTSYRIEDIDVLCDIEVLN